MDNNKKRVKLIVAYEGSHYCGWQIQPNGITIQEVLERELSALLKEEIHVMGASRTDAGVHALGNVAVFDTVAKMPAEKISYALNQRLPEDIVIEDSEEVDERFHPRFCTSKKTYEYRILNRTFPIPTERHNSYFYYRPLDVEKMQEAAVFFQGVHDFKSFCSVKAQVETTIREIYACQVTKENDRITIRITGSGFLYNMVRIIAGTLIQAGLLEIEPSHIPEIIAAKDRKTAGPTAPPQGLTLLGIEFDKKH